MTSEAPDRIFMPLLWEVGDGTIPVPWQAEPDDVEYVRADLSPQWRPISEAEDGDRIIVAGWQHQSGGTIGYWWYHEDVAWDGKATEHPSATHFTSISLPPFPEAPNEP